MDYYLIVLVESTYGVCHLVNECKKLAQKEYKRHDNAARKSGLNMYDVVEKDEVKLLWDMNIHCDNLVEARRPDIIVVSRKDKKCIIVD